MKIEIMKNNRAKSLAETCLLPGISGYLLLGITSKMVELGHILVDGSISLSKIATLPSFFPSSHPECGTLGRHHGIAAKSLHDHQVALQHSSPTIQQQHLPRSIPQTSHDHWEQHAPSQAYAQWNGANHRLQGVRRNIEIPVA